VLVGQVGMPRSYTFLVHSRMGLDSSSRCVGDIKSSLTMSGSNSESVAIATRLSAGGFAPIKK